MANQQTLGKTLVDSVNAGDKMQVGQTGTYLPQSDGTLVTGTGSAGAGKNHVILTINGTDLKFLVDET